MGLTDALSNVYHTTTRYAEQAYDTTTKYVGKKYDEAKQTIGEILNGKTQQTAERSLLERGEENVRNRNEFVRT